MLHTQLPKAYVLIVLALFVAPAVTGCSSQGGSRGPRSEVPLSPREGRLAMLFDDSIDPRAVGLDGQDAPAFIADRARLAEYVVRMKVATVTIEGKGADSRYNITLRLAGDPIVGPRPPADTLNIVLRSTTPGFAIARTFDLRLVGQNFIAFLRRFAIPTGEELHWHLARDTPDVIKTIRNAKAKDDLGSD